MALLSKLRSKLDSLCTHSRFENHFAGIEGTCFHFDEDQRPYLGAEVVIAFAIGSIPVDFVDLAVSQWELKPTLHLYLSGRNTTPL